MPAKTIEVPAELWTDIKRVFADPVGTSAEQSAILRRMVDLETYEPDLEEELRRERIIEIADGMPWVYEGQVEIDNDAKLSEGSDNGCYVSAWVWCQFDGTEFDRECRMCCEVMNSEKDLTEHEDYGKLCEVCLKVAQEEDEEEVEDES